MSIASEITRLQGAKSTLKTKLNAKNDEQHQITNETIDEYGDFVDSIEVIEPQTTEGESLSLTNTKAMPYSDYVVKGKSEQEGEPSPSNPSEIHSVADDVNLFDISSTSIRYGDISKEIVDNHLILTATGTTGAQLVENYVKNVDSSKSHTLSFKTKKIAKETDEGSKISIWVYGSNDDSTYTALVNIVEDNPVEGQEYSKSSTVSGYKYYRFYIYNNITTPVTVGEKTEYWDIKFQKGTEATPYSPYNQGTVTIKQRGKNKLPFTNQDFTVNNVRYYVQDGSLYFNGTSTNETSSKNINFKNNFNFELETGTYRISHKTGVNAVYLYNYDDDTNALITLGTDTASQTFTLTQKTKLYIGFYVYQKVFNDINIELMIEQRKYRYRLRTISR